MRAYRLDVYVNVHDDLRSVTGTPTPITATDDELADAFEKWITEAFEWVGVAAVDMAVTPVPDRWSDDQVQFPRLIAELAATQKKFDMAALCESMDLELARVHELFDRAEAAWANAKASL